MTIMLCLKALPEESPGELTVHCHILWEELFPNFKHEETNLRIFPGANKSKRQIIFGNLKQINQSSTHFVLRLSHGKDNFFFFYSCVIVSRRVTKDIIWSRCKPKIFPWGGGSLTLRLWIMLYDFKNYVTKIKL